MGASCVAAHLAVTSSVDTLKRLSSSTRCARLERRRLRAEWRGDSIPPQGSLDLHRRRQAGLDRSHCLRRTDEEMSRGQLGPVDVLASMTSGPRQMFPGTPPDPGSPPHPLPGAAPVLPVGMSIAVDPDGHAVGPGRGEGCRARPGRATGSRSVGGRGGRRGGPSPTRAAGRAWPWRRPRGPAGPGACRRGRRGGSSWGRRRSRARCGRATR